MSLAECTELNYLYSLREGLWVSYTNQTFLLKNALQGMLSPSLRLL